MGSVWAHFLQTHLQVLIHSTKLLGIVYAVHTFKATTRSIRSNRQSDRSSYPEMLFCVNFIQKVTWPATNTLFFSGYKSIVPSSWMNVYSWPAVYDTSWFAWSVSYTMDSQSLSSVTPGMPGRSAVMEAASLDIPCVISKFTSCSLDARQQFWSLRLVLGLHLASCAPVFHINQDLPRVRIASK